MSWIDSVGFGASAMVLATFCMTRMLPLRLFAIVSNILFGAYGYLDHLYPVLLLHLILLPVNCLRLRECLTETRLNTNAFDARSSSQARPPPGTGFTEHGRAEVLISSNDPWKCAAGAAERVRFSLRRSRTGQSGMSYASDPNFQCGRSAPLTVPNKEANSGHKFRVSCHPLSNFMDQSVDADVVSSALKIVRFFGYPLGIVLAMRPQRERHAAKIAEEFHSNRHRR